jgi:hypothetical protein
LFRIAGERKYLTVLCADAVRNDLTDVIGANLRSAHPLPMVLNVGENVDHTHDLHVKTFAHDGHVHNGRHMLCPNRSIKG